MTWQDLDIDVNENRGGQQAAKCPKCYNEHKTKSKTLSVNLETKMYNCHRCGWSGKLHDPMEYKKIEKTYIRPELVKTDLTPDVQKYMLERGISSFVLNRNKITGSAGVIYFNYYRGEELINVKKRTLDKRFALSKDAELIPYGLNDIADAKEVIWCEGEIDKLSWEEGGFVNCVSVPNGATLKSNNLTYLDNSWQSFQKIEKFYIATDGDEAGYALRRDLAHRLGVEKCFTMTYPENCKDANEVLQNALYGKEYLKQMILSAKPFPMKGMVDVDKAAEDFINYFSVIEPKGDKIRLGNLDNFLSFKTGLLYIITGYSGAGKSEFMDEIYMRLSIIHGWKFGVFSPENWPIRFHIKKLVEKYNGESVTTIDVENHIQMSALDFVLRHFNFIEEQDENIDLSIDGLLKYADQHILRYGIKGFIIDPYNFIEHQLTKGESETLYISRILSKLTKFCKTRNISIFLVAHPTKPKVISGKYPFATLYDISGSANFANKADVGISVYKVPKETNSDEEGFIFDDNIDKTTIYIQKIRFKDLGNLGKVQLFYNKETGLYSPKNEKPIGLRYLTERKINYRDISESQNANF